MSHPSRPPRRPASPFVPAAPSFLLAASLVALVSVTQRDAVPLALGQKVLVIAGAQARIVPDYTVAAAAQDPPAPPKPQDAAPGPAPAPAAAPAETPAVAPPEVPATRPEP